MLPLFGSLYLYLYDKYWLTLPTFPSGLVIFRSNFYPENKENILRLEEVSWDLQHIFHAEIFSVSLLKLISGRQGYTHLVLYPKLTAFMSGEGYWSYILFILQIDLFPWYAVTLRPGDEEGLAPGYVASTEIVVVRHGFQPQKCLLSETQFAFCEVGGANFPAGEVI